MSELESGESLNAEFDGPELGEETISPSSEESEITGEAESQETVDDGVELAPTESAETEKNTEEDSDLTGSVDGIEVKGPKGFVKTINKKHRALKEQERRAEEAEARLKELEAKMAEKENPRFDGEIPAMPDAWDDDYEAKMKARDDAIQRKALQDHQDRMARENEERAQQEARQQEQARRADELERYSANAKKAGISESDLIDAANAVADYDVPVDVAKFLLSQDDGPQLTAYLAANPSELEALARMDSMSAAIELNSNVRPKAAEMFKPKTSTAPAPATSAGGAAVELGVAAKYGATFE